MFYIRLVLQVLATLAMYGFFDLGMDWIDEGSGLNPWLAFPLSFILFVIVIASLIEDYRDIQDDYEDEQLNRVMRQREWNK